MSIFTMTAQPADAATGRRAAVQPLGTEFAGVLAAAQVGADWAWTMVYRSVAPQVRGYVAARGAGDPDNLVGEVFLQLARNLATFDGDEAGFRAWVFTIAHHRLLDEHRRARRRPAQPMADVPERAFHDEAGLNAVLTTEARALVDSLTPAQRDVVLLRVFGDLPLEEVARIVGRPVTAVKSLQHRGLATLRKKLSEQPYPHDEVWR